MGITILDQSTILVTQIMIQEDLWVINRISLREQPLRLMPLKMYRNPFTQALLVLELGLWLLQLIGTTNTDSYYWAVLHALYSESEVNL